MKTNYITLAGKQHSVEQDAFGITLIDGMPMLEWMDTISSEARLELARVGADAMKTMSMEYLADIADRLEMPNEQWRLIKTVKEGMDEQAGM